MLILVMPLVLGSKVQISTPLREAYNYGEILTLEGYVSLDQGNDTLLVIIQCNNVTTAAQKSVVAAVDGPKQTFQEIGIMSIPLNRPVEGMCRIHASVSDSEDTTPAFDVTPQLLGKVWLNKQRLKLGEEFTLQGVMYSLNGKDSDGEGDIFLAHEEQKYFVDTVKIKKGSFNYSKLLTDMPPGAYRVLFTGRDMYGNYFNASEQLLQIDAHIDVTTMFEKNEYLPGEELKIEGEADLDEANAERASATVLFNNNTYTTTLRNNLFKFFIKIPNNIRSGNHSVRVEVTDAFGNNGIYDEQIAVIPQPTTLYLAVEKNSFQPEDIAHLTVHLYDQANETMEGTAQVIVVNPKRDVVLNTIVPTNQRIDLKFPPFSVDGRYWIRSRIDDLTSKIMVDIIPVERIDVTYINKTVVIRNIGNIPYKKPIVIELLNHENEVSLEKDLSLKPNHTGTIMLETEVPTGVYDLIIGDKMIAANISLEDKRSALKKITGGVVGAGVQGGGVEISTMIIGWAVIVVLLGGIGYVIYSKGMLFSKK